MQGEEKDTLSAEKIRENAKSLAEVDRVGDSLGCVGLHKNQRWAIFFEERKRRTKQNKRERLIADFGSVTSFDTMRFTTDISGSSLPLAEAETVRGSGAEATFGMIAGTRNFINKDSAKSLMSMGEATG